MAINDMIKNIFIKINRIRQITSMDSIVSNLLKTLKVEKMLEEFSESYLHANTENESDNIINLLINQNIGYKKFAISGSLETLK